MQSGVSCVTASDFRQMITAAYQTFLREHEYINSLNVFPVPDGDTGSNMLMTLGAVANSLPAAISGGIGTLSRRAADSAIMGARGNSGVILSQIFRGIARGLAGKEKASSAEIGKAFQYGILYAYRSVAKPVEGTILTVAKGIAKGARRAVRENLPFADILQKAIIAGQQELARTPELLPTLKAAGVVDAGGYGLITFLRGCLEGLGGGYYGPEAGFDSELIPAPQEGMQTTGLAHPYCTEFTVKHTSVLPEAARQHLEELGDSLIVAPAEHLLKVHIHTAHPGQVLETALAWGTLHQIKIDNMTEQHRNGLSAAGSRSGLAVVSVVAGEGMARIMRSLGAIVIGGGQTMNPPVEEFIDAVHSSGAREYIFLPNNKNIVLAAEQAKRLLGGPVAVIPTVSVIQGLAALAAFNPEKTQEENVQAMRQRMTTVREGGITQAVRESRVNGRIIPAGAFIGVVNGGVEIAAETLEAAMLEMVSYLIEPASEIISLYFGAGLTEEKARQLAAVLSNQYQTVEIEIYEGGQPHYPILISME